MLRKAYTPVSMLLEAVAYLLVGVLFLTDPAGTMRFLIRAFNVVLWIAAANSLALWIVKRNEKRPSLLHAALLAGLAGLVSRRPELLSVSASIVFAAWILINAIAKAIYGVQLWETKSRGTLGALIEGALYALFSLSVFAHPESGSVALYRILGVYCLVRGAFQVIDALREILGTDIRGKRVRQRLRLKPPILLTALLPMRLLRALDDPDEQAEVEHWTRRETVLPDAQPNLEIFLHLGKNAAFGFGHVDIALDGKSYSFANYNATSNRLFGLLSDGILFRGDRDAYLRYALERENHRLIGYGVLVSPAQREAILKRIAGYIDQGERWFPSAERNPEQKRVEREANAEFYRIGKGPFKTYNVLTTNCVAMANMLSGSGGVDLMNPQGIITPGTYSEFLDRQFLRRKSIVVSRTVYR